MCRESPKFNRYNKYPVFSAHPYYENATEEILHELGLDKEDDYNNVVRSTENDTDDREILFCRGI